jgi:hypothetical protein
MLTELSIITSKILNHEILQLYVMWKYGRSMQWNSSVTYFNNELIQSAAKRRRMLRVLYVAGFSWRECVNHPWNLIVSNLADGYRTWNLTNTIHEPSSLIGNKLYYMFIFCRWLYLSRFWFLLCFWVVFDHSCHGAGWCNLSAPDSRLVRLESQ